MPAVTRVFHEPVTQAHLRDTMAPQAAGIPHFFGEPLAVCEPVTVTGEDQRMTAADAYIFVDTVPVGQWDVGVMSEKARQRMPNVSDVSRLVQVLRAAAAAPVASRRVSQHLVVNDVTPERATESHPQ